MNGGPTPGRALLLAALAFLAAGCAPSGTLLKGPEARQAESFFARMAEETPFPVTASFSGVARPPGRSAMPFIAGINATAPASEEAGLYDPMGVAAAFIKNNGRVLYVTQGPMAHLAGIRGDTLLLAGPVSMGRALSGAPAYPVHGGEAERRGDGGWTFTDARQTLHSDPGRKFLVKAEYRVEDVEATVEYPGRASAAPPGEIRVTIKGLDVTLRRDP